MKESAEKKEEQKESVFMQIVLTYAWVPGVATSCIRF
jgi:hypothetical protein